MCQISEEIREEGRQWGRDEGKVAERTDAIQRMLKKLKPEEIVELGYEQDLVMKVMHEVAS